MASIALRLKSDPKAIILRTSSYAPSHFFSTGSSSSDPPPPPFEPGQTKNDESTRSNVYENAEGNKPSLSSYLSDLKSSLKQARDEQPSQQQPQGRYRPGGLFPNRNSNNSSPVNQSPKPFDEISKHLSEFRRQSAPPPPPPTEGGQSPSRPHPTGISDLIRRIGRDSSDTTSKSRPSMDAIRESFRQMKSKQPSDGGKSNVGGGFAGTGGNSGVFGDLKQNLPQNVFGKEIKEREGKRTDGLAQTRLMRTYSYQDLGEMLRKLRPAEGGKKQGSRDGGKPFSLLGDLKERLTRLMEMDKKQQEGSPGKSMFADLRESLAEITHLQAEMKRQKTVQRLNMLGHRGGTSSFMKDPPKEHLVEKFFHPDNMSAAEKLKIELKKVRDEFKTHETDCGSSQVQIAQLTTEISHLSKCLHKKDKHSRKGLLAKVQQRKTLLRYLRRTDWDSYCFLLSKLGLRDNPAYKI